MSSTQIYFMDLPGSYGQHYADRANKKLAERGVDARVTACLHMSGLARGLEGDRNRLVIVVPHYYDAEAVVDAVSGYDTPPRVAYLQADGDARIIVPAAVAKMGKRWSVIRWNISKFEDFVSMCESLHEKVPDNVPDCGPFENGIIKDTFTVGTICGRNGDDVSRSFVNALQSDESIIRISMDTKNDLLDHQSKCDIIVMLVRDVDIHDELFKRALSVVDPPVYVIYNGDLAKVKESLSEAEIDDGRMLKLKPGCDMSVVLTAILKHTYAPGGPISVQQLYDAKITLYFNLMNYNPEYAISDRPYDTAFTVAKITGTAERVDQFVCRLRDRLNEVCEGARKVGVDVNPYAFFAIWIDMLQTRGIDCIDHINLLTDLVATPGLIDRDMRAAMNECCEVDLTALA